MGYYTDYSLQINTDNEELRKKAFEDSKKEFYFESYAKNKLLKNAKWYEHEEEMKAFSTNYPDVLFILYGNGEESDDIWRKYFKNGKMQKAYAELKFDEFDESKLA